MLCPFQPSSLPYRASVIDNNCVTDHESCAGAAQPKNDGGDFLGVTKSLIGTSFISSFMSFVHIV
jgi:hypothetical protein